MISQRLFDDVIRKQDFKEKKFKPQIEIDQQKSKLSLAEIYEQEVILNL